MWTLKLANTISKIGNPLSSFSSSVGSLALIIMMSVVVVDVILRATIAKGVRGNIEIVGLMLLLVFFAAYAQAEAKREHIQVAVFLQRFTTKVQQIITTNGYFLTIGTIIVISWVCFDQAFFFKTGGEYTALLKIPLWPFMIVAAFFIGIFVLPLLSNFFKHLGELVTSQGTKAYLWLLPGTILSLGLFLISLWPSLLPFEINKGVWGGIILLLLFLLIFLKVHIGAAMALTSLLGLSYLLGANGALSNLSLSALTIGRQYTWSVAPLFIWMGVLCFYGGFAKELYKTAYRWIGHFPGGLASATVTACAGLAALTGVSLTGVMAMGTMALPEMRAYKYDNKLATASICAAANIGMMIPPSISFIVFGMITGVSIGKLFIAGIFPGILLTVVLIGLVTLLCRLNPSLGPPGPRSSWLERLASLKNIWAVALLIIICLGGLYLGFFTATEAGAIGCFGALAIALARRRLSYKNFVNSMNESLRMTGSIFFIFIFATAFSAFLAVTNLPYDLATWVTGLDLSPYVLLAFILFIYVILGCIMNALPAVILTVPIFFPIVTAAGFHPVLFGVLITIMVELGAITPPIGVNVFAMSAIAKDVPMYDIFRGLVPFFLAFILVTIILVVFPQISLFLPNLMIGD